MYKVYEDSQFTGIESDAAHFLISMYAANHPEQCRLTALYSEYSRFKFRWSSYHKIPFDPIYRDILYINDREVQTVTAFKPEHSNDYHYHLLNHFHEILAGAILLQESRKYSTLKYWWHIFSGKLASEYYNLSCAFRAETVNYLEAYDAYCTASTKHGYDLVKAHDENYLKY